MHLLAHVYKLDEGDARVLIELDLLIDFLVLLDPIFEILDGLIMLNPNIVRVVQFGFNYILYYLVLVVADAF